MLNGVAIFVCCEAINVTDLVFVELFSVMEVKQDPMLVAF